MWSQLYYVNEEFESENYDWWISFVHYIDDKSNYFNPGHVWYLVPQFQVSVSGKYKLHNPIDPRKVYTVQV